MLVFYIKERFIKTALLFFIWIFGLFSGGLISSLLALKKNYIFILSALCGNILFLTAYTFLHKPYKLTKIFKCIILKDIIFYAILAYIIKNIFIKSNTLKLYNNLDIFLLFITILLSSIGEELLFRKLILDVLTNDFNYSIFPANVIQSIIFTITHFKTNYKEIVIILASGILFGYIRYKKGIIHSITLHILINTFILLQMLKIN